MKRTISVFLVIALAIASVFASGASEDEGRSLDVWYALSGTSGEAFMSIVEDFNALDTGITINASYSGGYNDTATKITAALANGSTPDVLIGGQVTYSGAYGNFYVADRAEADPEFDYDDVFPGLWEYGIYNGRNCNIPFNISTNMMFYNRQLVEEAGLDLEADPPQTWDDFIEVCKVLRDYYEGRPNFIPFVVSDEDWLSNTQIMQCGNEVIAHNDDYSLKTAAWGVPECAKVAKWWQDMVKEGLMDMSMNQNGSNVFLGGNAAFFAGSSTTIIEWSEAMGDRLAAIEMPIFDVRAVAMGGSCATIFPSDDEQRNDDAWTFVKFITSSDVNAKFAVMSGYLPIRASSADSQIIKDCIASNPAYAIGFRQLSYAHAYTNIDDYVAKSNALAHFRTAVTGDLSYDPLQAMQESAQLYDTEANG